MVGHIDSIETLGLVDGPGIRVVVFLQGCPLRCLFCHNPETWTLNDKFLITPEDLVRHIYKYRNYFGTDGGVTFSGGEPLFQHDFLLECLKLCKKMGINTCLDTSGSCRGYEDILKYVDLVVWDVKALDNDAYHKMTGQDISISLDFLKYCQANGVKMWIRQVIVPGINDNIDYINRLKDFIKPLKNVEKVELLPYHLLGVSKYKQLGIPYRLDGVPAMDKEKCDELYKILMS
jgi:pyruvate formate lyase activating enzyme